MICFMNAKKVILLVTLMTLHYILAQETLSLTNFFNGPSIIILKPIRENVIYFWVPNPGLNTNIPYNLRSRSELCCRNPKTVNYGPETISYLAPKIWSLVPEAIKSSNSLDAFKSKIRQWEPDSLCRLWNTYLQHLGFI